MGIASSIANLGPISTFTYTITNPPLRLATTGVTNATITLSWPGAPSAHYTIESTHSLNPPAWTNRPPHTNLPGIDGAMIRSVAIDGSTNEFFRVKTE
jgi:hypothetical protein